MVQQMRVQSVPIDFAVGDPVDFILIGDIDLQRWKVSLENIWEQTDFSQLDERGVEHQVYVQQCPQESKVDHLGGDCHDGGKWVGMAMANSPYPRNRSAAV